jgi:phospholipase C
MIADFFQIGKIQAGRQQPPCSAHLFVLGSVILERQHPMKSLSFFYLAAVLVLLSVSLVFLSGCGGVAGNAQNCNGGGCTPTPTPTPTPPPPPPADITAVNHVVIMLQENRSFDTYFGKLNDYMKANNYPQAGQVDGIPAGCDGNGTCPAKFVNSGIAAHHAKTVCMENLSPDWAEDRHEVNLGNPSGIDPTNPATMPMNGFVNTAAGLSTFYGFLDTTGRRAMGFYTDHELNYYYFLAANFGIGDAFYSPAPTNTPNNRIYMFGATSQGTVHTPGGAESCPGERVQISSKSIFQLLTENNISWKIYITDPIPTCGNFTPACMLKSTYLQFFTETNGTNPPALTHLAPLQCPASGCPAGTSDYFSDVKNGTLPSVSFIETGSFTGRDEHPGGKDLSKTPPVQSIINIQVGAKYVSNIINSFMNSPSWNDSVFFWAMDEGGGAFDHVPPMAVPNPDGIKPVLCPLPPNNDPKDINVGGDFNITGFRVPNIIISPFARKNFVSHTPMDYTAILKFIETRWKLSNLTARDAAMPTMEEFFDFPGKPWATPPTPPAQVTTGTKCDFSLQ